MKRDSSKMRALMRIGNPWMHETQRLTLSRLGLVAVASLAVSFSLSACENVASFTQPTLIRAIDASYIAPAVNITVEGSLLAANLGEGTVTSYATLPASNSAVIKVTATTAGTTLVSTNGILLAGHQNSVFITDNSASPTEYSVTLLQDQQTAAPTGQADFRFLNQATKTGAVDVYMVPSTSTLADSVPLCADLAVGSTCGYIGIAAQTVTMVITPTGATKPAYTSPSSLALASGQVRTVVIVDSQLTSNPPVAVVTANDVE